MSLEPQVTGHQTDRYRRRTEWRLVFGGFTLIIVIGGILLWLLWGLTIALVGLGIIVLAAAIFALLLALLRVAETWAKSG